MSLQTDAIQEPSIRFRDNPLLIAQTRRRMRGKQAVPTLLIAAIVGLCGLLFASLASKTDDDGWKVLCYVLLTFIVVALYLRGTSNVVNTMAEERRSGLIDFHRATPTTPMTDVLGYLIGCAARDYAASAVLLPFLLIATLASDLSFVGMLLSLAAVLLSGWLYHAFAMLTGLTVNLHRGVAGGTLVVLFILLTSATRFHESGLVILAYLTPLPLMFRTITTGAGKFGADVPFFGINLHPGLYTLLVQGSMLGFLIWANTRKVRRADSPAFSRPGSFAFFATLVFLFLGGAWNTIVGRSAPVDPTDTILISPQTKMTLVAAAYLFGAVAIAVVLIYTLVPSFLEVKRALRRAMRRGEPGAGWLEDGASAWPLIPAYTGLVVAGFVVVLLGARYQLPSDALSIGELVMSVVAIAAFLAFVVGAMEYVQLYMRKSWKSGALLIIFLAFVLPWMLAGIVGQAGVGEQGALIVSAFSPAFGLFTAIGDMLSSWNGKDRIEVPYYLIPLSITLTSAAAAWFLNRNAALRAALARDLPVAGKSAPPLV